MRRYRRQFIAVPLLMLLFATSALSSPGTHAATPAYAPIKRITISLSRQRLRAWVGRQVVLVTPVTTGNAVLPTPTGYFRVVARRSPYTFISPWPRSSRFWYPTATVSYALEFLEGGYFIHDAPWRTWYGRGSNQGLQPGTEGGGTHGCVNVPFWAAHFLYDWAPLGTVVHIVR